MFQPSLSGLMNTLLPDDISQGVTSSMPSLSRDTSQLPNFGLRGQLGDTAGGYGLTPTGNAAQITAPEELEPIIQAASQKYNVDPRLIKAIIKQESGFRPNLTSSAGAQGYMQLMPGTAKELGVTNVWDAQQNIDAGVRYFRQQLDRFGGDPRRALAAYNAGPGNVQKYGGIPPFKETQNYVKNILAMWGYN